jgi:phosphoglycerol transferase
MLIAETGTPSTWMRRLASIPVWVDAAVVSILCVVAAASILDCWQAGWRTPFLATGDATYYHYLIRTIIEHGWYTQNADIGAPFGAALYDFPLPEPTHLLLIRALGLFAHDPFFVANLFYLISFATTALAAWWSFRFIGLDRASVIAGAVLYTLLPYHFLRLPHLLLAAYFAAPIFAAHAARLALYRAPHVRDELRLTLSSLVLLAIAAGAGIYYAFFGCLLLGAGTILGAARSQRREPIWIGGAFIATAIAVIAVSLVPNCLFEIREGANALVAHRQPFETEYYGLRITQLLLPSSHHRFAPMRALTDAYNAHTPLLNENTTVTLGVIGSLGLLVSLAIALTAWRARFPRVAALGTLSLVAILFATLGGFGSLFAQFVTPEIRALNRISVYIAFFGIASFFLLVRRILHARPLALAIVAMVAIPVGAFDEVPKTAPRPEAGFRAREAFFERIDATLPKGTAVFELPYMFFPEGAKTGALVNYELIEPYVYTHGFRWSFGDMRGRPSDVWNARASMLHGEALVAALANAGYGAVYLDRRGYDDRGAAIEQELSSVLGPPILEEDARNRVLYRIPHSAASHLPFVVLGAGRNWSSWTRDAKGACAGVAGRASTDLVVANPGRASRVTVAFTLVSREPRHVALRYGELALGDYDLVPNKPESVEARFTAATGVSRLVLDGSGGASGPLAYRIDNLVYRATE